MTVEKLLDQDPIAGSAEYALAEEQPESPLHVVSRLDDQDAFAPGEAVGLENRGITQAVDRRAHFVGGAAHLGRRGRDSVPPEKLLGENLRGLDLRGQTAGSEDRQLALREEVSDPERQGDLGSDDGQVDPQLLREIGELHDLSGGNRKAVRDLGNAGIAGSAVDLAGVGALRERPAERVLARAPADDEDSHGRAF